MKILILLILFQLLHLTSQKSKDIPKIEIGKIKQHIFKPPQDEDHGGPVPCEDECTNICDQNCSQELVKMVSESQNKGCKNITKYYGTYLLNQTLTEPNLLNLQECQGINDTTTCQKLNDQNKKYECKAKRESDPANYPKFICAISNGEAFLLKDRNEESGEELFSEDFDYEEDLYPEWYYENLEECEEYIYQIATNQKIKDYLQCQYDCIEEEFFDNQDDGESNIPILQFSIFLMIFLYLI